jgi:hypothetical protein
MGKTGPKRRPIASRFWSKVDKSDDCWEWQAYLRPDGYGSFRVEIGYNEKAHRMSWILTHGPIPDGLFVCHVCDNRRCVRPDHLFLGSHQDNMDDAKLKGRFQSGDMNPSRRNPDRLSRGEHHTAKLTEEQVRQIRARYTPGYGHLTVLGREYGVTPDAIKFIVTRRNWKHI